MTRPLTAILAAILFLVPLSAAAQTSSSSSLRRPVRLSIGAIAGTGAVEKAGGLAGAELGLPIGGPIEVFGEGVWIESVATRHRLSVADPITAFLQSSQGKTATGTVKAPAVYGG